MGGSKGGLNVHTKGTTRLLVCGSRDYKDFDLMFDTIKNFITTAGEPEVLIHGAARGADSMAAGIGKHFGIDLESYPVTAAEWQTLGKSAGRIRNKRMLDKGKPTHVLAFFSGGHTRGTDHMVEISRNAGLPVEEYGLGGIEST